MVKVTLRDIELTKQARPELLWIERRDVSSAVCIAPQGEVGGPGQKGSKGDKGELVSLYFVFYFFVFFSL